MGGRTAKTSSLAALALAGCGVAFEPPWVLDEARVLAVRIDVVEEGPWSQGLLPIPADRVRHEPLPMDTVSIEAIIADADGLVDTAALAPRWFRCDPTFGPCFSLLREPDEGQPCTDVLPPETSCWVGDGARVEWTVPPLTDEVPFEQQVAHRFAMVSGRPGVRSTEDCLAELAEPYYTALDECILAYAPMLIGPIGGLSVAADALGIDPPGAFDRTGGTLDGSFQPNFHPALVQVLLQDPLSGESWRVPESGTVQLPAHAEIWIVDVGDPRDRQTRAYVEALGEEILVGYGTENFSELYFVTAPGDVLRTITDLYTTIYTDAPGETFELFVVLSDRRGSQTVGSIRIEVVAE